MKTKLTIDGTRFFINGRPTYSELDRCPAGLQGLLMNARMIQGVFDDRADPRRFDRFGRIFDPGRNTDGLCAALPAWYAAGLRAITVGFQGGGPCFTMDNATIENNPYSPDGGHMDPGYLARMDRIIRAADEIGMAVIVSLFYAAQTRFLRDDAAVTRAVETACGWLKGQGYTNVIVEVANELDIAPFAAYPVIHEPARMAGLIALARERSGGMPVGCSGTGGYFSETVAEASDVILIHGNSQTRQGIWNLIRKAKAVSPARPIVMNEDSQALGDMAVCLREGVSWGYYNNMTKQEPPADWGITEGEDRWFALRMALALGITEEVPPLSRRFYFQGLEPDMCYAGKRWIRLAALFPEEVDHVDFFRNGIPVGTAYEDPFALGSQGINWFQPPFPAVIQPGEIWRAEVRLRSGETLTRETVVR